MWFAKISKLFCFDGFYVSITTKTAEQFLIEVTLLLSFAIEHKIIVCIFFFEYNFCDTLKSCAHSVVPRRSILKKGCIELFRGNILNYRFLGRMHWYFWWYRYPWAMDLFRTFSHSNMPKCGMRVSIVIKCTILINQKKYQLIPHHLIPFSIKAKWWILNKMWWEIQILFFLLQCKLKIKDSDRRAYMSKSYFNLTKEKWRNFQYRQIWMNLQEKGKNIWQKVNLKWEVFSKMKTNRRFTKVYREFPSTIIQAKSQLQ